MTLTMQDIANGMTYSTHHDVQFWDFNSITASGEKWRLLIDTIAEHHKDDTIDMIIGLDARGFLLSGALGYALGADHVTARKAGKLPGETIYEEYGKEYVEANKHGQQKAHDQLHLQTAYIEPGMKVLVLDDVLATGGTAEACCKLIERLGATVAGVTVVIELPELGGRGNKLAAYPVHSLISIVEGTPVVDIEYCVDILATDSATEELILIERKSDPKGIAMPGGRIEKGESVESAAVRELAEETNCVTDSVTYTGVLSGLTRDPRGVKVSTVVKVSVDSSSAQGEVVAGKTRTDIKRIPTRAHLPEIAEFVLGHGECLEKYWFSK